VWSLFAALGLFVARAAVSVTHHVQQLVRRQPASDFVVGYVVLGISFVLEGVSFLRSIRQARAEATSMQRDLIEHVLATSDPTLHAVVAEDAAGLIGLMLAAAGLAAHQLTGSAIPDAVGSILVGVLLAVVAIVLINLNRRFLVGQEADPPAARRHPEGPSGRPRGRPGDLPTVGGRRTAHGLGRRRRRSSRRRD